MRGESTPESYLYSKPTRESGLSCVCCLGACQRGLTCPYQHDPAKIAICWPFLQGNCPNDAQSCALSHDPTLERTPLCVHFANNGRCKNGDACLYPHVHVGPRTAVCRDFAVLGYCDKGLECDNQHVRECPDFAEKGTCANPKCRLPHVIRANRHRKPATISTATANLKNSATSSVPSVDQDPTAGFIDVTHSNELQSLQQSAVAGIGDEYISLTFLESDSSEEDESDEEEDSDEDEKSEKGSHAEEDVGDVDDENIEITS